MPANKLLLDELQQVFNLLPNLASVEMVEAFAVKSNDSMLALYLASLIRSVVSLHDLINNRLDNRAFERKTFGFVEGDKDKPKPEEKKEEKKKDMKK
jgi:26S proteasome regulatory subunit N8